LAWRAKRSPLTANKGALFAANPNFTPKPAKALILLIRALMCSHNQR
jgi:hypothetical protein